MISKVKLDSLWSNHASFESRTPKKWFERGGRGGMAVGKYQFDFSFFFHFFPKFENLKYYLKYREHQTLLSTSIFQKKYYY